MKILIVDDDKDVADSMAMLLELFGYELSVRYTAAEGLSEAQRLLPDVILHDLCMPEMSGYEAVVRLRAQPKFEHTLILALTAHDGAGERDRAQKAGFDVLLSKPADVEWLARILKERHVGPKGPGVIDSVQPS